MNIPIEEKKAEAVRRMKLLKIFPETIKQFEKENLISESAPPLGACFWLNEEQMERVRAFEKEYKALVYFAIHSYTNIGEMENYLFVSDYKEDWELEQEAFKVGQVFAYVYNCDSPDCSEMGSIGVERTPAAGLRRTW